jgi:hypothetical protein
MKPIPTEWKQISMEVSSALESERQRQLRYVKDMVDLVTQNLKPLEQAKKSE